MDNFREKDSYFRRLSLYAVMCLLAMLMPSTLQAQEIVPEETDSPDPTAAQANAHKPTSAEYHSPYSVKFSFPEKDLLDDIIHGSRGNFMEESNIPHDQWYSRKVLKEYGSWGPQARHYPRPEGIERRSAQWERERVIAVALRFTGYNYNHHHIPDWNPPAHWPQGKLKRPGKGIDCSDFTAFVYTLALGLKTTSSVVKQAQELRFAVGNSEHAAEARRIERPRSYEDFIKELKTGDLLFIKSKGRISHVIIWVGSIGQSPDGVPLILDSTNGEHKDLNGVFIPNGVHLRPFYKDSWYFKEASHAIRVIRNE